MVGALEVEGKWILWYCPLAQQLSQRCLADDQFNFNFDCLFSRKLCPGNCSMRFEQLQPFFRDSPVSESMHFRLLSASSNPGRNRKKNRAWIAISAFVSAAALVLLVVSST
ncbi:hypothetical protein Dsin_031198 [Dipteronia sinensis]|uniref:Uncharacterized protein n=1 Tax=Dipteronia sinensis TaxID=43782 RepID=A0AAD9ZKT4_9ROSI|nr:hypothetical protein Dsin_031198 [Dipteronia sinensis]